MIKRFNVDEKINQYIETGDINVRNEIVAHYMYIVKKVAKFYAEQTGLNVHELESFGYEGLIMAINSCNLNKKKNFNNYITIYIRGYIFKGIPSLYGFKGEYSLNDLAEELNYANQHTASEMKRIAITKLRRPKTLARIKAIYTE